MIHINEIIDQRLKKLEQKLEDAEKEITRRGDNYNKLRELLAEACDALECANTRLLTGYAEDFLNKPEIKQLLKGGE